MWPIVERSADVAAIVERLERTTRRAQAIVGPAGIGKTTLARMVSQSFRGGRATVVTIVGLTDLAAVPWGALTSALVSLNVTTPNLNDASRDFLSITGGRPKEHLIVVDDAHLLDVFSASVIYQAVRAFGVPVVLTMRQEAELPESLNRLHHEDIVDVTMLGGLNVTEIGAVLHRRFDAPVRPDHVDRLVRRTQGNPLFLRELVESAARAARVVHGTAGVEIEDLDAPRNLMREVEVSVGNLSADAQSTLRLLALTQPVSSEALGSRSQSLNELIDHGIVRAEDATADMRVAHPLYAEAAVTSATAEELENDRLRAAQILEARGDAPSRFAAVLLRVETIGGASPTDVAWAVRYAYAVGDHTAVVVLADYAQHTCEGSALDVRIAIDRASSMSALGDPAADDAFTEAWSLASAPTERALAASRHGEHLAYRRFDVATAVERAEKVRATIPAEYHSLLDTDLMVWKTLLGYQHEAPAREGSAMDSLAEQAPELALRAAMTQVMTESMRVDSLAAKASADAIESIVARAGQLEPLATAMFHLQHYFALLSQGEGAAARAVVEEQRSGPVTDAVGMWTYTLAIHQMYGGHMSQAQHLAELATQQLHWRDTIGLLGASVALQATIAAHQGKFDDARDVISVMTPTQQSEPKALMLLAECQALGLAAATRVDDATSLLVDAARTAVDHGHLLVAAISLGLCIRLGEVTDAVVVLNDIANRAGPGSALIVGLRDLARAVDERDAHAVIRAATVVDKGGMTGVAIDALLLARHFTPSAETRRKADRRRLAISAGVDGRCLQDKVRERDDLTERQWSVVRLAADRLSSREIAEHLGVSVRTVDNHLAQIYRKLGISRRTQLREVVDDF